MLNKIVSKLFIVAILFYQKVLSPIKPRSMKCRFYPTCSRYGIMAYEKYGAIKGTRKLVNRFMRCRPDNRDSCIDYP